MEMLIIPIITTMDLLKFNSKKEFISNYTKEIWNNIETNYLYGMHKEKCILTMQLIYPISYI